MISGVARSRQLGIQVPNFIAASNTEVAVQHVAARTTPACHPGKVLRKRCPSPASENDVVRIISGGTYSNRGASDHAALITVDSVVCLQRCAPPQPSPASQREHESCYRPLV